MLFLFDELLEMDQFATPRNFMANENFVNTDDEIKITLVCIGIIK